MNRANLYIRAVIDSPPGTIHESPVYGKASDAVAGCLPKVEDALMALLEFLGNSE